MINGKISNITFNGRPFDVDPDASILEIKTSPNKFSNFRNKILQEMAHGLSIPLEIISKPEERDAFFSRAAEHMRLERIRDARRQKIMKKYVFDPMFYEFVYGLAKQQYHLEFGKLPCGKSKRSRINKKRKKKIMKWFSERGLK